MAEPEVTGIEILRTALNVRNKTPAIFGGIAHDLGLSNAALHAFSQGAMLPDDKLQALCTALFNGHTIFNSQTGMLRSANREPPKPAGIAPAPFDPAANSYPPKAKIQPGAPPLYAAPKTPPAKKTRPGWLGGFT